MSFHFEHAELPGELPRGEDTIERLAAVLVMVVACLGAFAVYVETQTSNREAVSDRNAKLALLDLATATVGQSQAVNLSASVAHERTYWLARSKALAALAGSDAGSYLGAEARAATSVAATLRNNSTLGGERAARWRYLDATLTDQEWAHAYERERDQRTSQVTRLIAVITNFAICLFLFALVATVPAKLRPYFIAVPCIGAALTIGWGVRIWTSNVQGPNEVAIKAYVNGNYDKAISLVPGYEQAHLRRGDIHYSNRDFRKAAADLRTATRLDPQDFSAFNDLAASYWWLHDYEAAFKAIQRAATLNPGDATVVFNEIEGIATTSNDQVVYGALVKRLEAVLKRLGPYGVPDYRGDFDDLAASARERPEIAAKMQGVCRSLLRLAAPLHIGVGSYRCDPLRSPNATHARFRWKGRG